MSVILTIHELSLFVLQGLLFIKFGPHLLYFCKHFLKLRLLLSQLAHITLDQIEDIAGAELPVLGKLLEMPEVGQLLLILGHSILE